MRVAIISAVVLAGCAGRSAEKHYIAGSKCFDQRQFSCAINEYRAAVAMRPDHAPYRNAYGAALGKSGRIDQAITEFEAAIALDPGFAKASDNLARAHRVRAQRNAALVADEVEARRPTY